VRIDVKATVLAALVGGPGVIAAVFLAAPAMADPAMADPTVPAPVIPFAAPPAPPPLAFAAPAPPPEAAPAPAPVAASAPPAPPEGVPHLSSPENLPPGTTDTPPDPDQPRSLSYLRDLWHAVQTQEVSGKDALLLLTQRPMNADAVPPPGMPANPTPPMPVEAPPTP
jgi:resuscitation-promoting factor RpfA